jgi:peroxidase
LFTIFGQLLDHDLSLDTPSQTVPPEHANIVIPAGDSFFVPGSELEFTRSFFELNSNSGPRQHVSIISPWLDAGNVYGSNITFANSLRSWTDGKMLTSSGDLLPKNGDFFIIGDVRGN